MKPVEYCRRCNRKLKDDKSKELGFGKVCYEKYLRKKKTYLFEMNEVEDTDMLGDNDVRNFYQLYNRFSLKSSNIGILGDEKKYKDILKTIQKKFKGANTKLIVNEDYRFSIINGDLEYTYILIRSFDDKSFIGRKFRKYV